MKKVLAHYILYPHHIFLLEYAFKNRHDFGPEFKYS